MDTIIPGSPSTPERDRGNERARERENRLMTSPSERRERQAAATAQRMQNPLPPPSPPFQNVFPPIGYTPQTGGIGISTPGLSQNDSLI